SRSRRRSSRTAWHRMECGRRRRTRRARQQPYLRSDRLVSQAELFERGGCGLELDAEERGDRHHVAVADGEHLAVEVLALHLDEAQVGAQQALLLAVHPRQAGQVDGDLGALVERGPPLLAAVV